MAEAKPNKRRGGHAYGRRNQQMSNTAEEGELCLYVGHSLGRFSSKSMRFDSHQACVRCVAAAREGRISFDVNRLLKKERRRALKFWSQVDIAQPDECWEWLGTKNPNTQQPQFAWRRPGISSSTQHHPQRVAMWFTWGDLGFTGVKTTCGNKYCCNPFHLIPQRVGVFVDHDSFIESFEVACELHTLRQQVAQFQIEEALKAEEKLAMHAEEEELDAQADLLFNPNSSFNEKFEAVIVDMLAGKHISQTKPDSTELNGNPIDNADEENPTNDF